MPVDHKKTERLIYALLFLIAFSAVFSSTNNPLNFRRMHFDASVYISVANGIANGQLPYRDFADNKGPFAYLLSVPGIFFGGFTGIWITELILLFITVVFAYKTALFFGNRTYALLGTTFAFIAIHIFFFINAGTEEYALPFLAISLYVFTKHFFNVDRETSFGELVAVGSCFAAAVLVRLNMFPLWLGFCLAILVETIIKRQFIQLLKYLTGFCLGIIAVVLPLFLWMYISDIFNDFLEQVIFIGSARGFTRNLRDYLTMFYETLGNGHSFLPLFFGVYMMIIRFKQSDFSYYTGYTVSYLLMVLFFALLSDDKHYNLVLIPYYVPVLTFLTGLLYQVFIKKYSRRVSIMFLALFFCFVYQEAILRYAYRVSRSFFDTTGAQFIAAGKTIDENTKPGDTIISLGFDAYIYPFTERKAASRFIYQSSYINQIAGSRDEFLSDILNTSPAIIVLYTMEYSSIQLMNDWHGPILEMIKTDYHLLSDKNGFDIYKRNAN